MARHTDRAGRSSPLRVVTALPAEFGLSAVGVRGQKHAAWVADEVAAVSESAGLIDDHRRPRPAIATVHVTRCLHQVRFLVVANPEGPDPHDPPTVMSRRVPHLPQRPSDTSPQSFRRWFRHVRDRQAHQSKETELQHPRDHPWAVVGSMRRRHGPQGNQRKGRLNNDGVKSV